jgi:hypothetical protein
MEDRDPTMRDRASAGTRGAIALLLVLAGCDRPPGVEVLEPLQPGTPKAEVLALFPDGGITTTDPMEQALLMQGYWFERYFLEGEIVEVIWIHDVAEGYPEDDFRANLTPVIFKGEVLDGWGWDHFDARHEEWLIVERQPTVEGVSAPIVPLPSVKPESPEVIPSDSAPSLVPRGDGSGSGTTT